MVTSTRTPKSASTGKRSPKPSQAAPSTPTGGTGDPIVDMLNRYNFKYEKKTVPLADIDIKASRSNQARIAEAIDEDQGLIYAEQMKNGDQFPPIVGYFADNGKLRVMDGNHRVFAADIADIFSVDAYVVDSPSPAEVQSFTFEANTKHGLPTSLSDRLRQGVFLHEKGVTLREAAERLGIEQGKLQNHLDAYQAEKRFIELGIPSKKLDRLTISAKRKLDAIQQNPVLKAAAELVVDSAMSTDDIARLVREVNSIRTGERDQLREIARTREARSISIKATAGGRVPFPPVLTTLARGMTLLNNLDFQKVEKALNEIPAEAVSEYGASASRGVTNLMAVVRAVQSKTTAK